MKTTKLDGTHEATMIHGLTGQEIRDCLLPGGLAVSIEGVWGPSRPDPYYADRDFAYVVALDDGCRYRVWDPRF